MKKCIFVFDVSSPEGEDIALEIAEKYAEELLDVYFSSWNYLDR